jgi:hypothetical protein
MIRNITYLFCFIEYIKQTNKQGNYFKEHSQNIIKKSKQESQNR